jgi:hypothetical protein
MKKIEPHLLRKRGTHSTLLNEKGKERGTSELPTLVVEIVENGSCDDGANSRLMPIPP